MSFGQYNLAEAPAKPALPAKTKRIKTVFGSNDTGVEHVWAHPRQKDGSGYEQTFATNPQRNFYFKTHDDGTRVLYSYRDSYPIGARFQQGKRIVFLVRSGKPYSHTTAEHMHRASNAATDEVFRVPYVTKHDVSQILNAGHHYGQAYPQDGKPDKATHKANLADYVSRIQEAINEYTKARATRNITWAYDKAHNLIKEAKRYAKLFGLKLPKLPTVPKLDAERMAKARQSEAIRDARDAEKRELQRIEDEKRAAQRRIECAEIIAKWKNGEDVSFPWGMGQYSFLRVRNGNVETSQRVTVPIAGPTGAARLLRFLQACKAANRTYQTNGHSEHIGSFTVQSFGPQTPQTRHVPGLGTFDANDSSEWLLTAGCHRILWSEVQSVADAVLASETAVL